MWEAVADYADGKHIKLFFEDSGEPENDQQYMIEAWLLGRHPDCVYYSVVWIND